MRKNSFLTRLLSSIWVVIRFLIVTGTSYYILLPILLKLSVSFMERTDLYDTTVRLVPRNFTLSVYEKVYQFMSYNTAFINTLSLSVMVTFLQLASCMLVGYGLARFKFPGQKLLFAMAVFTLIVPPQTIVIPSYLNFRFFDVLGIVKLFSGKSLNLINSIWTFVISASTCMGLRNGLYIFVARQYFRNVPKELEDAALIDGAGSLKTFLSIMVPNAKPIMTIIIILSFAWQWTDVFYTSWYLSSATLLSRKLDTLANTVSVAESTAAILTLDTNYMTQINATGTILVILPLIIFYLFVQRQFVESVERAGIVG